MGSFHIGCGFYGVCHGVLMATILLFAFSRYLSYLMATILFYVTKLY